MPRTNISDISHMKRIESIARFEDVIFHCISYAGDYELRFLEFFNDTNDNFIKKYRVKYPRYSFKIYKDKYRPMPKGLKDKIKIFSLENVLFRDRLRDYNLKKLLES